MEALDKLNQTIGGLDNEVISFGKLLSNKLDCFTFDSPEGKAYCRLLQFVTDLKNNSSAIRESIQEVEMSVMTWEKEIYR